MKGLGLKVGAWIISPFINAAVMFIFKAPIWAIFGVFTLSVDTSAIFILLYCIAYQVSQEEYETD